MEVFEVRSKKDLNEFHRVPRLIYKDDPNWIPHLRQDIDKIFDPKKNKLFAEGSAIRFVLRQNGEPIGRIAAFVNAKTAYTFDQPTGGVGFFECINDQKA